MSFYKAMQADKSFDCVVIGGGASGMMAAITAARNGANVAIIEHTGRLGSKILQTGNGKCNFTNLAMDIDCFQNDNKDFVADVLSVFDQYAVIEFFKELGVWHKERNGYIYPHSETAASLQDALRMEVSKQGVNTLLQTEVLDVCVDECGSYSVKCADDTFVKGKCLVLATGSKAAPKTGSDGSGYKLAKKLGVTVKKPLPALVQLVSDNSLCKAMAGVRSTGLVSLYVDGKVVSEDTGEVQYADYGISGIPVFQISRYAVKAVDEGRAVVVKIDMIPDISKDELYADIRRRYEDDYDKNIEQFFAGIVNKKLVYAASKLANIDINACVGSVKLAKLNQVVDTLKAFEFNIVSFKGFDSGQICQGGVALEEINPATMEHINQSGLFFAGEVLDVDGKCGGYNLQWAWSSGFVAGLNAALKANEVQF